MGRLEYVWSIFSCGNCVHGYKRNTAFGDMQCRKDNCENWFITRSSRICDHYKPDNSCPTHAREMFNIFKQISGGRDGGKNTERTESGVRIEKA